jgi:uncharacterized phage-associated protein
MKFIQFKFAAEKAKEAIIWMLSEHPGIDLHALLKACYFADKSHLNKYGRPVFGATYQAMRFGPVPIQIYEMAKGEAYWLAELGLDDFPWALKGYHLDVSKNAKPNLDLLSETDLAEIQEGLKKSVGMTFNSRTSATHGSDWQSANLGTMRYEDMVEDGANREQVVAYLKEAAPHIRL